MSSSIRSTSSLPSGPKTYVPCNFHVILTTRFFNTNFFNYHNHPTLLFTSDPFESILSVKQNIDYAYTLINTANS